MDTLRRGLSDELARVSAGAGGALALEVDAQGRLVSPRIEREPVTSDAPADLALHRYLAAEIDLLERSDELERARARLLEVSTSDRDPWLAAWALTALGAIESRAQRDQAARDAWRQIVEYYPGVLDERGLRRSFAARLALAGADPSDEELLDLYADVCADHASAGELATQAFKERLAASLADRAMGPRLQEIRSADRERERVRQFRAAWRQGVGDWVARGAVGGVTRFGSWLVAARPDETAGMRGGAIELRTAVDQVLTGPEIATVEAFGFETVVTGLGEAVDSNELPLARRDLAAPFSGLAVSVYARDLDGLLQRERRGFFASAALVGAGLLFSLVAAVATVRAIGREVEAARGREAFVAAVTHELKAPLASIRLLGEVLEGGGVEEEKVREFGRRTASEAERLSRVITSVLELARLEHVNGRAATPDPVDLNGAARRAVETFEPQAREGGFRLRLSESPEPVDARVRVAIRGMRYEPHVSVAPRARGS